VPTLTVADRFCGPPGSANGGYFAGLFAQHSTQPLRIRLERPIPLNVALEIERDPQGRLELRRNGASLARADPAQLELHVPQPPDYLEALEASRRFIGFDRHAFPACFVCGIDRARGDGLRIFAGEIAARGLVAAPWVPDVSLAGDGGNGAGAGKVRPEFMWAALDCPGYFAARSDGVPMLLGQFMAQVDRCVHVDEPCVVIGWRIAVDGRKFEVGTALFDEDGEPCGRARALWIEPRQPPDPRL
jgi:hypothetical protein